MTGHVRIQHHSRVATLTLARPEVHNAFDDALIAELTAALEAVDRDEGCARWC